MGLMSEKKWEMRSKWASDFATAGFARDVGRERARKRFVVRRRFVERFTRGDTRNGTGQMGFRFLSIDFSELRRACVGTIATWNLVQCAVTRQQRGFRLTQ